MKHITFIVSFILILMVLTVFATAASYYYYPPAYGGTSAFYRRNFYAPSSQQLYFGENWNKHLGGFGSKGTWSATPRVSGGSKSYTSPSANLLTNAYTPQGRNPNKISNWDPRFRGYERMDKAVVLESYNLNFQKRNGLLVIPKATARLISQYGFFGVGGNDNSPKSDIHFQANNLPPLGSENKYELWLFDEETGFSQSLGLFYAGIGGTAQMRVEFLKPITMFDYVGITLEPYPDLDPRPGKLIMLGAIDPSRKLETAEFIESLT